MDPLVNVGITVAVFGAAIWWRRRGAAVDSAKASAADSLRFLREAGDTPTEPTEVSFYLYFADRAAADAAARSASTPQLTATVSRAADDSAWLVLVSGTMIPTESAIVAETTRLEALASSLGGQFDGWEAES